MWFDYPGHTTSLRSNEKVCNEMSKHIRWVFMAEREGFEPPVQLPAQQISSLPP